MTACTAGQQRSGVFAEVGGMVREGEGSCRLVLRHTVAGHAESLMHEVYGRV